jgi:uncharacterized protein
MQAGILLSAVYILNRGLCLLIFLHFSWDFAEPGIFGAINPANTVAQSLLTSKIAGSVFLTGGQFGSTKFNPITNTLFSCCIIIYTSGKTKK